MAFINHIDETTGGIIESVGSGLSLSKIASALFALFLMYEQFGFLDIQSKNLFLSLLVLN